MRSKNEPECKELYIKAARLRSRKINVFFRIQDYEYLVMAEKLLGKDYVDRVIRSVTNGLESYTASDEFFMSVRNALGNAIEKAARK